MKKLITTLLCLISFAFVCRAQTPPDFSKLPAYQTPIGHSSTERSDYNLGATGMRGWIYGMRGGDDVAREILVRVVEKGSPADGVFEKFDLITGVNGKQFTSDAREALAAALEAAEVSGELKLLRWRDGKEEPVTLKIEVLGAFSSTAPYDCPKSAKIVKNTCEFITTKLLPERRVGMGVPRGTNALMLLATGDPIYLPQIRRYARDITEEFVGIKTWEEACGRWTWHYGYKGLFLAEYYLATGDRTVLPALENVCGILAKGQGIPGAWCHSLSKEGHILPGYGAVNSTGMVCLMAMALSRKCGVPVDAKAIADGFAFFSSFAGKGGPPYGDHPPYASNVSNGKSGGFAVAMTLLDSPNCAKWFSNLAASGNGRDLYNGHTGNLWNHTWSPMGAALAGRESFINFCKKTKNNYTLMRRWDHGSGTNPDYNARECYAARRKYGGPEWGPGAFNLFLTVPKKRLQIMGAPRSVFALGGCPKALKQALVWYEKGEHQECLNVLQRMSFAVGSREEQAQIQLEEAAEAAILANVLGVHEAAVNIRKGDLYLASVHLDALAGVIDPRAESYRKMRDQLATDEAKEMIAIGKQCYQYVYTYANDHIRFADTYSTAPMITISPDLRRKIEAIVKNEKAGVYREMAKKHLAAHPLHSYQRVRHEWLALSEYSPLKPIFFCGKAVEKDVPNTDIFTPRFSATPGERVPVLNRTVGVEYMLPSPKSKSDWQKGSLPVGGPTGKDKTKALLPKELQVRIRFNVDDPAKYSEWFITCCAPGETKIDLNGKRIVHIDKLGRGARLVHLKPASAALFKAGKNTLVITAVPERPGRAPYVDLGLDALPK